MQFYDFTHLTLGHPLLQAFKYMYSTYLSNVADQIHVPNLPKIPNVLLKLNVFHRI